jgi:hypothetical protein
MNVLSKLTYHHLDLLHHWRIRKCRLWGVTLAAQLLSNSPSSHLKTLRSVCLSVLPTTQKKTTPCLNDLFFQELIYHGVFFLWDDYILKYLYIPPTKAGRHDLPEESKATECSLCLSCIFYLCFITFSFALCCFGRCASTVHILLSFFFFLFFKKIVSVRERLLLCLFYFLKYIFKIIY